MRPYRTGPGATQRNCPPYEDEPTSDLRNAREARGECQCRVHQLSTSPQSPPVLNAGCTSVDDVGTSTLAGSPVLADSAAARTVVALVMAASTGMGGGPRLTSASATRAI